MSIELAAIALAALVLPTGPMSLRDGTTIPEPSWGSYAVPATVDYVAVVQIDVDGMQNRTKQITINQSGYWHRETFVRSGKAVVTIVDLRTGRSFQYLKPRRGIAPGLSIAGSDGLNSTVLKRTELLEHALGETCRVWNFKTRDITKTFCLTADGIPLWHRWVAHGNILDASHAISIIRRHVEEAEVALPGWALDLRTWGARPEPVPGAKPNDKVLLTACPTAENTCQNTLEVRRLGGITASTSIDKDGRWETYVGPLYSISSEQTPGGKLRRLDIQPTHSGNDTPGPKPVNVRPPREMNYAGERCAALSSSNAPDASHSECLSADGILLASFFNGWTSRNLQAKVVTRGKTTMRDVLPPDDILRRE